MPTPKPPEPPRTRGTRSRPKPPNQRHQLPPAPGPAPRPAPAPGRRGGLPHRPVARRHALDAHGGREGDGPEELRVPRHMGGRLNPSGSVGRSESVLSPDSISGPGRFDPALAHRRPSTANCPSGAAWCTVQRVWGWNGLVCSHSKAPAVHRCHQLCSFAAPARRSATAETWLKDPEICRKRATRTCSRGEWQ